MGILPPWLRQQTEDRDNLQEIRLRKGLPPELIRSEGSQVLLRKITEQDLDFCVNMASRYSPWTAESLAEGYLTAPGGHRIGLCGQAVVRNGTVTAIKNISSLCIRVARDVPGIGKQAALLDGNILVIGAPGAGKTTLLRDIVRTISDRGPGSVAVVDQREELFPESGGVRCFPGGIRTDVLSGCPKPEGIDLVLRCMGPAVIALDEITAEADCSALIRAGWCGVRLLATAHAGSVKDLQSRQIYRKLWESRLFDHVLVMHPDKSWHREGMEESE